MSKKDNVAYSLQTLCHPASEFLADGQRLTLFIKRGNEAASEILRLRAENEKLRAAAKEAQVTFDATWSEADLLRVENNEQRQEIEKLRAVLKPFADIAAQFEFADDNEGISGVLLGELRAAAAALKETGDE